MMLLISTSKIRSIIKSRFPDLVFTLRTVSFSDLARTNKIFLESKQWGMCKGNTDTYQAVKAFCEYKGFDVIVSF